MTLLDRVERFIYASPAQRFLLWILVLMLVKTGLGVIPNLGYFGLIAHHPFANSIVEARAQYLMWNWLGPFVAWLLGVKENGGYFLLHLAFTAAFIALFMVLAFRKFEQDAARTAILLFAMLPASTTSLYWVGYNSLTLPLILVALAFPGRWPVAAIAGVLIGMQHFEQGFAGAGALVLATLISRRRNEATVYPLSHSAAFFVGVTLGKLALIAIFYFAGIEIPNGRVEWIIAHFGKMAGEFAFASQYILYSIFGVGWLAAMKFWDNGRNRLAFFLALIGLCLLLPISEDETRVIAIVSFPLVLGYWLFEPGFLMSISRREAAVAFLVWVLVPWAWVWQGVPHLSALPYFVMFGPG